MGLIKVYQRESELYYPRELADSVHFAQSMDGVTWETWNLNYGILFAKGILREDNTIAPRSARNPRICKVDGQYYIMAECVDITGTRIEEKQYLLWSTYDFVQFTEHGMRMLSEFGLSYEDGTKIIEVKDSELEVARKRWIMSSVEPVDVPICVGFADPVLFVWKDSWYMLATNDNNGNIGLFLKKAKKKEELFAKDAATFCILPYDEERGFIQTFWAPEFHTIGGEPYILFAVGGKEWAPQCHMMRLKTGGILERAGDWENPVRIQRMDGSYLAEGAISLDMTYLKVKEKSYLAWSYREHIGSPLDSGSMVYIASIDEKEPWRLTSEPVLLTRPLYGWENVEGTINNEGPYPLQIGTDVYLTYSGGAACGYSYAVGYLKISEEQDLLDASQWEKQKTPFLHTGCVKGEIGPGHISFFYDEERLFVAYHIQEREKYNTRCATFHEMDLSADGFLRLKN